MDQKLLHLFRGIILSLQLICISNSLQAKIDSSAYIPFPDSNVVWAMECFQGFQGEWTWYEHYWVGNEDTTISGKEYHKLFNNIDAYIGAYRNDTILRHVYYVESPDSTEILFYDFSLNVGDTFQIPYPNGSCGNITDAVLVSMESELIGSENRRRFNFSTVRITEGVGSSAGLFEFYTACFEYQCILRCFKSGDSITLGTTSDCNLATNSVKEGSYNKIAVNIYPNPVFDKLTLENIEHIPFTYEIFDYLGHLLISGKETEKSITVDVSTLANGIYFMKIELEDKNAFYTERIIKTD